MKVLVNQSTGYLFGDVATALSKDDDVVLLCSKSHDLSHVSPKVRIIGLKTYDKTSTIKRLWTWLYATVQIWWTISTHFRKAELLIVSNPPFANLLALVLPNKHISHLIYDIYPDVLTNSGIVKKRSFVERIWTKANRRTFKNARHIYTIGEGMADCLSNYIDRNKIEIINCWPDIKGLNKIPRTTNKFIVRHHLEDKFIVLYSGNLGITHRVEALIEVAQKLIDYTKIHFVIIGEGGKKKLIQEKMTQFKLNNISLLPYQSIDMLSHSLSSANLSVVTLDPNASQLSVPSKTFNLLYLGKPILALGGKDSELSKLIDRYNFGKIFSPDDIDDITEFILTVCDDEAVLKKYGDNAINASKEFSIDNADKFLS